jgi:NADH dehydrogenase [ubiquinone] 1 alpha subcomplex assembly factor 7
LNGLGARLRASLAREGPISVARFMALALLDRRGGYYATRTPIGAAGDFTTAPEISQCFGELLGVALARTWLDLGRPEPVTLVELGPGRGTLMLDLLRAIRGVPGLATALELHLIEPSPSLRAVQAERLAAHRPRFHETLASVPTGRPLLLVANEVLDALPIRQLVRDRRGWRERLVGLDATGRLAFVLAPTIVEAAVPEAGPEPPVGTVVELGPAREALVAEIAARLAADGGLALLVDFGRLGATGDSLRAVRGHRPADPLDEPGTVDLAADVDFAALRRAARAAGAAVFGPVGQGRVLERLGIGLRLERLAAGLSPAARGELEAGVRRLVEPEGMGERFKVLALTAPGAPPPAGFLAEEEWRG